MPGPPPPPLRRLFLLGGLRLDVAGEPRPLPGSKARDLLALLCLHPEAPARREVLVDRLWPHAAPDRGRRYLSDLLYRLQRALGYDWLAVTAETVALRPAPDLWVDAWAFERLIAAGDPASLEAAAALYRGDLLPEIYDDWVLPRRAALRERYLALLERLAARAEADGRLDDAFTHYHRLSYADPLNESPHRGLMRLYARQDRLAAALAQYERLRRRLEDDLGVVPAPETTALADALRAAAASDDPAAPGATPPQPFVGRRRERAALLAAAERAAGGRGGIVLLEGDPGQGKTRLLEALAEGAAWRGLAVAWGRGVDLEAVTPYAPLVEALDEAVQGPRLPRWRDQLPGGAAEALVGLLPRLSGLPPGRGEPSVRAPVSDQVALLRAAVHALGALGPQVLILDDIQWAGRAFWDALPFAAGLEDTPVLLVLAYRPADLRARPAAWAALEALDRVAAPLRLTLAGMSPAECAALAANLGHDLAPDRLGALHRATAGNPLFLGEMLASRSDDPAAPSLDRLLDDRLAALSASARAALDLAAVLGREFGHNTWQAAAGAGALAAAPELVAARFLHETPAGYEFQHDLTRERVLASLQPDRLARLHRRAAEALLAERARPETLAWHFERAGAPAEAARYHRLAGEASEAAHAYEAALAHYDRGLALLAHDAAGPDELLALRLRRQGVLRLLARLEAWRAEIDEIARLAQATGDLAARLTVLEARIRLSAIDSDLGAMQAIAGEALDLAADLGDPALEARLATTVGFYLAESLGAHGPAMEHLRRAAALAEAHHDMAAQVEALCHLAFSLLATGQARQAEGTAARALALAALHPYQLPARAHALMALGQVAMDLARWEQAWSALGEAVELYDRLDDAWNLGDALFNFALAASSMGQHAAAVAAVERFMGMADAAGLAPDSDIRLWHRALQLRVTAAAGRLETAAATDASLAALIETMAPGRARLAALTARGLYALSVDRPDEALISLGPALELWRRAPNPGDVLTPLLFARAAARRRRVEAARALADAEAALAGSDTTRYAVLLAVTRHEVTGDAVALAVAREGLEAQAALFADPARRRAFLEDVPLHRALLGAAEGQVTVRLARRDAPLGRTLSEAERVDVRWTVDAGAADEAFRRQQGKVALRRHRLRRLLAEAAAQGAAPTDSDLAAALGVSRRTIERDMAALAAAGVDPATRRRA